MKHIDGFFDSRFLRAGLLNGEDKILTIKAVRRELIDNYNGESEHRPVLDFEEAVPPLVLNRTNATKIKTLFGPDTDKWPGKAIQLFPTTIQAFGRECECIRVREEQPKPAAKKAK